MIKTRALIVFNTGEEVETSKTVEQVIDNAEKHGKKVLVIDRDKGGQKLFVGTGNANIIAQAKTAAVFGRLISAGLVNLEELNALIDEVNNAD